ncbi:P2X purinoceptor 7-like [Ylistrum balloti]|uniref:P2X purinoceptor 7-like n=1 Tax=Ylistrum balloti TaxID=509963 RepID=UPI002905C0BF|nr:P2X purinoceptor 7-like [Ylistrum balloti]
MVNIEDSSSLRSVSDDDSVDLLMSDGSSGLEIDETAYSGATQPHMFEPETDSSSDENSEADPDVLTLRLGGNKWCRCGHCQKMSTETESICCQEIEEVQTLMSKHPNRLACITDHPGFEVICLNVYVLETAYLTFRQYHGPLPDNQNKKNRYIAYRQFVRWCWGWLGRHVRVTLPACAVSSIRNTFPAPDGQYNGFHFE